MTSGEFSSAVESAADGVPASERFGRQVYISDVRNSPQFRNMSDADFRSHMVSAFKSGAVELTRAELRGVMNQRKVDASEIETVPGTGFTVHFVIPRSQKGSF